VCEHREREWTRGTAWVYTWHFESVHVVKALMDTWGGEIGHVGRRENMRTWR